MIFINYRKGDTQSNVDFLAEGLKQQFGDRFVFKDDQDIQPGEKWPDKLENAITNAEILLVVIGNKWLTMSDEFGRRRIDNEEDWVRREICTAFNLNKIVLVILVNDAKLPIKRGLPADCHLQNLPDIQHIQLRSGSNIKNDIEKIINSICRLVPALKKNTQPIKKRFPVVAFDLDGTLIRGPKPFSWKQIWEHVEYSENVRRIGAQKYLKGEWSHQKWCSWACEMFREKGLKKQDLTKLGENMTVVKNLRETLIGLKNSGIVIGLISGGIDIFLEEALPEANELFDFIFINKLQFDKDNLICGVEANSFDFEGKVDALKKICDSVNATIDQAVFVGEGFNDMAVMRKAGMSLAFAPVSDGVENIAIVLDQWDLALLPPLII